MSISRAKKEEIVTLLKEKLSKAKSLVFVNFHGLSVAKASDLRKKAREEGTEYLVAKKTLTKIAFKESGREIPEDFEGEVGIIWGFEDELAPFRVASSFAREAKNTLKPLAGFFSVQGGGEASEVGQAVSGAEKLQWVNAETAERLGSIPSREALIAQLMSVLVGNTRKLVYVIDQIKNKRSNENQQ